MWKSVPAAALLVLALAACGGDGGHGSDASKVAAAHWAGGLRHWGAGMTGAINGISILFSRPARVLEIQSGAPRTSATLRAYERALSTCDVGVKRLGKAPATLGAARAQALRACSDLRRAAMLIRAGVLQFQHGLGYDLLTRSADPLDTGQQRVRRALLDLVPATS
jgi:hypothetical protein